MSIVDKIKEKVSKSSQRALGLDGIRFNLQTALERLERVYQIESKLAQIENRVAGVHGLCAGTNDQFQNLKRFLTWYSNRVEPWFWTGNFSQSDPEEELAGLLINFLPGRSLIDVGPKDESFAKAAAAVGYDVLSIEPPATIASLAASKTLPAVVDFLKIAPEHFDLEMAKCLDRIKSAVVQTAFVSAGGKPIHDAKQLPIPLTPTEIISELRSREYYWNLMIFRTETEGFIRMATNLAGVPRQAWGSLLFFQDQQLFLKAFHWCKTTLPRFRAAPLAG
ncbi:MAG: hypothetical protein WAK31_08800 [Chthoniobacterales bacterium]